MHTIFDGRDREALVDRLRRLTPDHAARWGRMSAPQMIVHLADAFRMALGQLAVAPSRRPLRYPPLKQLIVYWLPFPRGAPTAPELRARRPGDWHADLDELLALVARFAARRPEDAWPEHPLFGRLSGRAWGVLAYRHTDHHLRQFGV